MGMEMEAGMITVSTEELRRISEEVDHQIDQVQRAFEEIENRVSRTSFYWEGNGRESFSAAYQRKTDTIRTSLNRFREQTQDLRTMAGIYDETELAATELSGSLSDNVIA
ncbi:MAG: WXG100 family type VII secretion target [Eubacteriales bacterium]|nr:WXG100 family type VII secretion target [Eubacteriales bacterium]